MDNIFVERIRRSLNYEAVYLREMVEGFSAQYVIGEWIVFYNTGHPYSALGGAMPAEAYAAQRPVDMMDKASALLNHHRGSPATSGRSNISKRYTISSEEWQHDQQPEDTLTSLPDCPNMQDPLKRELCGTRRVFQSERCARRHLQG